MELISIAHPKFRSGLILEAKKNHLIYSDQAYIPGKAGDYPSHYECYRTTSKNLEIYIRPVKISDEPLLKELFYDLSDQTLYRRFISTRKDIPHHILQDFVIINYTREMILLAFVQHEGKSQVAGIGQYRRNEGYHTADVAFVVRDQFQQMGIGRELLRYLTFLARKQGFLGFTAEVLIENVPMLHLFESMGFDIEKRNSEGIFELKMTFREF